MKQIICKTASLPIGHKDKHQYPLIVGDYVHDENKRVFVVGYYMGKPCLYSPNSDCPLYPERFDFFEQTDGDSFKPAVHLIRTHIDDEYVASRKGILTDWAAVEAKTVMSLTDLEQLHSDMAEHEKWKSVFLSECKENVAKLAMFIGKYMRPELMCFQQANLPEECPLHKEHIFHKLALSVYGTTEDLGDRLHKLSHATKIFGYDDTCAVFTFNENSNNQSTGIPVPIGILFSPNIDNVRKWVFEELLTANKNRRTETTDWFVSPEILANYLKNNGWVSKEHGDMLYFTHDSHAKRELMLCKNSHTKDDAVQQTQTVLEKLSKLYCVPTQSILESCLAYIPNHETEKQSEISTVLEKTTYLNLRKRNVVRLIYELPEKFLAATGFNSVYELTNCEIVMENTFRPEDFVFTIYYPNGDIKWRSIPISKFVI